MYNNILDFFNGSGTTAEAVIRENANGNKNKYILYQRHLYR